ncbi:MAG: hypothetical protein Q9160_008401 [Pyrenula sp. 1 TL-2023]
MSSNEGIVRRSFSQLSASAGSLYYPIDDERVTRFLISGFIGDRSRSQWSSITGNSISFALEELFNTMGDFATVETFQPVVIAKCSHNDLIPGDDPETTYLTIGDGNQDNLKELISFARFRELGTSQSDYDQITDMKYTLVWQEAPHSASEHSPICVDGFKSNLAGIHYETATACTIDAYWARAPLNYKMSKKSIYSNFDWKKIPEPAGRSISMSPDWVGKVTQAWLDVVNALNADSKESICFLAPDFLAVAIADTVSKSAGCTVKGNQYGMDSINTYSDGQDDCPFAIDGDEAFSRYWTATELDEPYEGMYISITNGSTNPRDLTQLVLQEYSRGYGYDSSEIPVQLSLAILATYALLAIIYIIYTLATGRASNSWDSIAELVMLGVNSKTPEHLEGTSVGIDTLATFREPVSIRVNERDCVELVFENDAGLSKRHLRDVEPNEAY